MDGILGPPPLGERSGYRIDSFFLKGPILTFNELHCYRVGWFTPNDVDVVTPPKTNTLHPFQGTFESMIFLFPGGIFWLLYLKGNIFFE